MGPARETRFREHARENGPAEREWGAVTERPGFGRRPWRGRPVIPDLRRRRPVPVRLQSQLSDCGPVCLSMTLGHHGIDVSVEQLRLDTDCGRDGVSAKALLTTARSYGLAGRGVRASLAGLGSLPAGSILFWKFNHFVVLERVASGYVYVVDPAHGRRRLRMEDVSKNFTGVALEFDAPLHSRPRRGKSHRPPSPWRHLAHFFPRSRKWIHLVLLSLGILLFGLVTPLATAHVVGNGGLGEGLRPAHAAVAVGFSALSFFLLQLLRGLVILKLQTAAEKRVTLGIFNRLLSLPYAFFSRRAPADLALRVRTSSAVRHVVTNGMVSAVFDGVLVLSYLAVLMVADVGTGLWVLALAVVQSGVLAAAWRRQVYLSADTLESQAQADSELTEVLEGMGTVKSGGLDQVVGDRWANSLVEELNARTRGLRHFTLVSSFVLAAQFTAPLCVLAVGAVRVTNGDLTLGAMTAFASLSVGVFMPLTNLVLSGLQVAAIKAPLTRLGDILDAVPEESGPAGTTVLPDRASLKLEGVSFVYPGAAEAAVSDVDLVVPGNGFVAVLGASGCGKSTLAMILAGLYTPKDGRVLVGSTSLATIDRASLRRSISFVNQDARIFAGSIHRNITMGAPEATPADVEWAARTAHIHDDIARMPMGYETLLGPGGAGLSGGQRQRISLARALVRRPRILILDEATSALDRLTEARVIASVRDLGCTLIMITHRLAAAVEADEIAVVDGGRVVQRGSHRELASVPGPYRSLASSSTVLERR
ncbi:peptidase domain-containing ABC transporter [Streptomyces rubiginosohelvolus]|uniref:peptidase domain-containing ABC transporter n=1 Tax=Streptomyces TaxID=1883 RepID=UPI001CD513FA|nr:peptidase domain-containing ABC transporter [Streptomyces sp. 7G]MCA1268670.1 peptidase domain-containing ABC transporter [Streptomyces sp. 7G]